MSVVFSIGEVRIGDVGATLTSADNIPNIQSIALTKEFQEALIQAGASISKFPVADAQFDAQAGFTFETKTFAHKLLKWIAGVAGVVAGGKTTYTPTHTSGPQYCRAEFLVPDPSGKVYRFIIARAKILQFNATMGRTDFAGGNFSVMSRPGDPSLGFAPWSLEIDN